MKEDAQLVCPICYEDPDNKWELLQPILQAELPLREVSWKSPISASSITIDKLPLRFLPSSASLFKDTEHAFRWLLAPYVQIYILVAETLDVYKTVKGKVRKWIDTRNANRSSLSKCPYFIIYLPLGTQTLEVYNKVNYRISSDFYVDRAGDHSVMVFLPHLIDETNPQSIIYRRAAHPASSSSLSFSLNISAHLGANSLAPLTTHVIDVMCLLREGIVRSFQQRCAMYDSEIRRLDSARGSNLFDFRQLFLVKESLALMYQMLQLFDMALAQYEELEAILSYAQIGSLPDGDWPMVGSSDYKVDSSLLSSAGMGGSSVHGGESVQAASMLHSSSQHDPTGIATDEQGGGQTSASAAGKGHNSSSQNLYAGTAGGGVSGGGSSKDKEKDIMSDAVKNGDDIAAYSINLARMKILKNKMTLLELHRYVYARQMYFLILLQRPVQCAQNSRTFLLFCYNYVLKRYSLSTGDGAGQSVATSSSSHSANDDGDAGEMGGTRFMTSGLSEPQIRYIRYQQLQVWALTAGVKIVRVCRDLIAKMCTNGLDATDFAPQSLTNVTRMRQAFAAGQPLSVWPPNAPSSSGTASSLPAPPHSATPPPRHLSVGNLNAAGLDPSSSTVAMATSIQLGHVLVQAANANDPSTPLEAGQSLNTVTTPAGGQAGSSEGLDSKRHLFREAYIILAEILQFCACRLHKLTPVCSYARSWTSHHCLTTTSLQATWGALKEEHSQRMQRADDFFLPFVQQDSSRLMMQQELDSLRSDKPDSLSNVLVSLSQRLRSVSHCWAKIYCTMPVDFSNTEIWNTERDYLTQRNKVGFSRIQTERGLVLECAVALLLREGLWELFTLSDRFRLAYACKVDCVAVLVAAHQFDISSPMAEGICRLESMYLSHHVSTDVVPKAEALWAAPACGWEELQRYVLAMQRRAALGARNWERERATTAALLLHHLLGRPSLSGGSLEVNGQRIRRPNPTGRVLRGVGSLSDDLSSASSPSEVELEVEESVHYAAMQGLFDALAVPDRGREGLVPIVLPLPHFWSASLSLPQATRSKGRLLCDEVSYRVCVSSVSVTASHPLSLTLHWRAPFLPSQALVCRKIEIVWKKLQADDLETVRGYGDLFLPRNLELAYQGAMAARMSGQTSTGSADSDSSPSSAASRMVTTCTEEIVLDPRQSPQVTLPFVLVPQRMGLYLVEQIVLHCDGVVFFDACLASRCRPQHAQWCPTDRVDVRLTQSEFQSALDANFVVNFVTPPCAEGVLRGAVSVPHCSVLHTTDHLVVQLSTAPDEEVEHITIHTQCTGPATALTSYRALVAGARPTHSWRLGSGLFGSREGGVSFVSDEVNEGDDADGAGETRSRLSVHSMRSPGPALTNIDWSSGTPRERVEGSVGGGGGVGEGEREELEGEVPTTDEVTVTVATPADWVIDLVDTTPQESETETTPPASSEMLSSIAPASSASSTAEASGEKNDDQGEEEEGEEEERGVHIPAHRAVTILIPYMISVPATGQRLGYAIPIAIEVRGEIRYTGTGSRVGFHIRATATLRGAQLLQGEVRCHAVHSAEGSYCYDARVSNVSPLPLHLAAYGLFTQGGRRGAEGEEEEEEEEGEGEGDEGEERIEGEKGLPSASILTPHPLPFVSSFSEAAALRSSTPDDKEKKTTTPCPVALLPGEDWHFSILIAGEKEEEGRRLSRAPLYLFYWRSPEAVYPGMGNPDWVTATISSLSLAPPPPRKEITNTTTATTSTSTPAKPSKTAKSARRRSSVEAVPFPVLPWLVRGQTLSSGSLAAAAGAASPPRLSRVLSPFRSVLGVCTVYQARLEISGLVEQRTLAVHYRIEAVHVVYEPSRRQALAQRLQSPLVLPRDEATGCVAQLSVEASPDCIALGLALSEGFGEKENKQQKTSSPRGVLDCLLVCLPVALGEHPLPRLTLSLLRRSEPRDNLPLEEEEEVVYRHVYSVTEGPRSVVVWPSAWETTTATSTTTTTTTTTTHEETETPPPPPRGSAVVSAWPGPVYQLLSRPDPSASSLSQSVW